MQNTKISENIGFTLFFFQRKGYVKDFGVYTLDFFFWCIMLWYLLVYSHHCFSHGQACPTTKNVICPRYYIICKITLVGAFWYEKHTFFLLIWKKQSVVYFPPWHSFKWNTVLCMSPWLLRINQDRIKYSLYQWQ